MSLFHYISPFLQKPAVNILLQTIINQFLSKSYCLTFVSNNPIDFNFNLTFTFLTPNETVEELKDQLLEVSERGCSDYIVNMDDQAMFIAAFDMVSRTGNVRRSDRHILFLPPSEYIGKLKNESLNLFSMTEMNFISNILMILQNTDIESNCDIYDLFTHKFVGADAKTQHEPLFLDQWDSCTKTFKTGVNLFPHDLTNLYGKTVKVATFIYKPYVLLDLDPAITPTRRDGMELRIVEELCRWINCTIHIVRADEGQWGEIFANGTGNGVMGRVVEDRADFGLGALFSWYEDYLYLDFSLPHTRSAVICVTPSPRILTSWILPLIPFTWIMWYAILITFLLASLGVLVAKRGSLDGVFITVFGTMVSQSQKNAALNWRVRSVTGWIVVAALILNTAYGGGLASTFTVPKYEPSIDTAQDLVDAKMEWGATHDAWIFSLTLSNEPLAKELVNLFRLSSSEELKRMTFTRSLAFAVEKLPAGNFAIGDYLTTDALEDMTLMLEDFYFEHCVIMMRKSSLYTKKISTLIGRLHASGLLLSWETQIALKYLNYKQQQEVKLSRLKTDSGFKRLNLKTIVGIFMLYGIGVIISILLFVTELLFRKD